jgi:hypothetical protein
MDYKMKIYISGKITGIEDQAEKLFQVAEDRLTAEGYDVINPLKLNHNHDKSYDAYMKEDVKALCDCDCIYMLLNWQDSNGAKIEKQIAEYLKIKIIYE